METERFLQDYYEQEGKKLRSIVDKILSRFGGIYQKDYDDFYSIANEVLAVICETYDKEQGFEGYFYSCLSNKIKTEITKRNREKRKADRLAVSLDMPAGEDEDVTLGDILPSDFCLEKELEGKIFKDERVETYLESLSELQRQVLEMRMQKISALEIKKKLGITQQEYRDSLKAAKQNQNMYLFSRNRNDGGSNRKGMETKMEEKIELELMDTHKMDKYSLYSLLDAKKEGEINCQYVLQRKPFQWKEPRINKYISTILNNEPIPEIIICEQIKDSHKISWLIDGLQRLTYAEEFMENRLSVGEKGAEDTKIAYKDYKKDEKGNKIVDEYGSPQYEVKLFDIVGKYYHDLPEYLQKRFNDFNINVTKFFNCSSEKIAHHIRRYNGGEQMSPSQDGVTHVGEECARKVKNISENHRFFKDIGKYTMATSTKGVVDRIVFESLMAIHFLTDWQKKPDDMFIYLDRHLEEGHFTYFIRELDRLAEVVKGSVRGMFNVKDSFLWFALFDRFTTLGVEDGRFVEFMSAFQSTLHSKMVGGRSYDELNTKSTKDKKVVQEKLELLQDLMHEYLGIEEEENGDFVIEDPVLIHYISEFEKVAFVQKLNLCTKEEMAQTAIISLMSLLQEKDKSNAAIRRFLKEKSQKKAERAEDALLYLDILGAWSANIAVKTPLFSGKNLAALLGMVAYACEKEIDRMCEEWFVKYAGNFEGEQEETVDYQRMIKSLNYYISYNSRRRA